MSNEPHHPLLGASVPALLSPFPEILLCFLDKSQESSHKDDHYTDQEVGKEVVHQRAEEYQTEPKLRHYLTF